MRTASRTVMFTTTGGALRSDQAAAAHKLGMTLAFVDINVPQDLENATTAAIRVHPNAAMLDHTIANYVIRRELADFTIRQHLPMCAPLREQAIAGSLLSYGPSLQDLYRKTAIYIDKIFKGVKPGELPMEQPTKCELVINFRTAKALGITIPQQLLLRADEVLE